MASHVCWVQLSPTEAKSVEAFLPHYFQYMKDAYAHNKPTILAKIVGVYRIGFSNNVTRRSLRQDVFIMENLFYDRNIANIYDLKVKKREREREGACCHC